MVDAEGLSRRELLAVELVADPDEVIEHLPTVWGWSGRHRAGRGDRPSGAPCSAAGGPRVQHRLHKRACPRFRWGTLQVSTVSVDVEERRANSTTTEELHPIGIPHYARSAAGWLRYFRSAATRCNAAR